MNDKPETEAVEIAPAKKRGRPKKVVEETKQELLIEVPPTDEKLETLIEVPDEHTDDLLVENVSLTSGSQSEYTPADFIDGPVVNPTPPRTPRNTIATKQNSEEPRQYTSAQIKKLRSAYSRRTLLTRFGISW